MSKSAKCEIREVGNMHSNVSLFSGSTVASPSVNHQHVQEMGPARSTASTALPIPSQVRENKLLKLVRKRGSSKRQQISKKKRQLLVTEGRCKEQRGKEVGATANLSVTIHIGAGGRNRQMTDLLGPSRSP